jgi:prevent-host-death family protein
MTTRKRSSKTVRPGVNVHEAKTHLSRLLARVSRGEEIIIGRAGQPVAKLVPYTAPATRRVLGQAFGEITIAPDFDQLPDQLARAWEDGPIFPRR